MKSFRELSEGAKENKELKSLSNEIIAILKEVNADAKTTNKMSEEDKLKIVYSMMKKLKEINPIVNEMDDYLNMTF